MGREFSSLHGLDYSLAQMALKLDSYDVVRLLGKGGTAEVWLGTDRRTGQPVALKALNDRHTKLAERLRHEGALLQTLEHPHVVGVHGVEEADGLPVLVMAYVQGPTLATLLDDRPRLELEDIDAIAAGVLRGVAAAHARGWVHRDLKPSNVLLAVEDGVLVPKVADFGLIRALDPDVDPDDPGSLTRMGAGTRAYMSIEQLSGAPPDPKMDVFALGALLYELIEGKPAFARLAAWRAAVDHGQAPPLRREVPTRMARTVRAALAKDADRPANAQALLDAWGPSDVRASRELVARVRSLAPARTPKRPLPPSSPTTPSAPLPARAASRAGWFVAMVMSVGFVAALLYATRDVWSPLAPNRSVDTPSTAARRSTDPRSGAPPHVYEDRHAQRRFALAWEQFIDVRLVAAEQTLLSLTRTHPQEPDLWVLLALVRLATERHQESLDALAEARRWLASADRGDGDLRAEALIDALEKSVFFVPEGDPWPALVEAYPDDLLVQAVGCSQLGLRPEAETACRRGQAMDDLPVLSWVRGQWALVEDQHDLARREIDAFLASSPNHPRALLQDGWWHAGLGDWDAVQLAADRALAVDPALSEARLLRAHVFAHRGDLPAAESELDLALGPTTSLAERMKLGIWETQAAVGRGQLERADARLSQGIAEARASSAWFWVATAELERVDLAWVVQDADRIASALPALTTAAAAPEVADVISRRLRATVVYASGLEAVLRGDVEALRAHRTRLEALPFGAVGRTTKREAVTFLSAHEAALEGDPTALMDLARQGTSCDDRVRSGAILLRLGHPDEAAERLQTALDEVCPHVGYGRYLRGVAHAQLADLARQRGDDETALAHEASLAQLRPRADR